MNTPIRRPWFDGTALTGRAPGDRLQDLLQAPGIVGVPGTHDALAARLAQRAGFKALYLSGAALSASMALPDLGVITLEELCQATRQLVRAHRPACLGGRRHGLWRGAQRHASGA